MTVNCVGLLTVVVVNTIVTTYDCLASSSTTCTSCRFALGSNIVIVSVTSVLSVIEVDDDIGSNSNDLILDPTVGWNNLSYRSVSSRLRIDCLTALSFVTSARSFFSGWVANDVEKSE